MTKTFRYLQALIIAILASGVLYTHVAADNGTPAFSLKPAHANPAHPETQTYFIYDTTVGTTIQDEVIVRNTGTGGGVVRLFAVDAATSANSGITYLGEGDPRQTVGRWIGLAEGELTLGPGEEKVIAFSITIPMDAPSGQHLGGLVALDTAIRPGTNGGSLNINTQARMVSAVQVNLPGPKTESMTVAGVSAGGTKGNQTILLALRNDGTEMVKPNGSLTITDAQGQQVQDLPIKMGNVLPRTQIQYPVAVQRQALGAGTYHATLRFAYGESGILNYEGEFTITDAQITKVFPSTAPVLAAPQVASTGASAAPATTTAASQTLGPLLAGGAVLLVLAVVGGIFLGRRGRSGSEAK